MSASAVIFALFVFATFFNNALHWYTQVSTYPLLGHLQSPQFIPYHQAYERRLTMSIYLPYGWLMLSNLLLFFVRPARLSLTLVLTFFVLNALITVISLTMAAPVHTKLDRDEITISEGVRRIVRANSFRLLTATASSVVLLYWLLQGLAK